MIMADFQEIIDIVQSEASPAGFEAHPFKIGWYNELVDDGFKLSYPNDTLAIILISTPHMFDKTFKPYICRQDCTGPKDPIDECMIHHFNQIKEKFPETDVEILHDFEMLPDRRPKVLVQTAGHVAGAARYYQRKDLTKDPWEISKKIYGVSVHPEYGGWFALRGVLIFTGTLCPDLPRKEPEDIVNTDELKKELLERYNDHWQDWSFRDIIPVKYKYSEEQKEYFATLPKNRQAILEMIRSNCEPAVPVDTKASQ